MINKSIILDANALIFFITDAGSEKGSKVAAMIGEKVCLTPIEVIAEAVYVLSDKYKYTRREISERLKDFIKLSDELVPETNVVLYGLNLYDSSKLDFVDCLLDGYAKVNDNLVFTFDDDLRKQLEHKFYHG